MQRFKFPEQADQREYEAETGIREGIECLRGRLDLLVQAAKEINEADKSYKQALNYSFAGIDATLRSLAREIEKQAPPPPPINIALSTDSTTRLVEISQTLNTLQARIDLIERDLRDGKQGDPASSSAKINVTTTIINSVAVNPIPRADSEPRTQINPKEYVRRYFARSGTKIEYALAAIPDPRVPRHRRQYDNAITAIGQGMVSAGFVLDSFSFPWSKDLQTTGSKQSTTKSSPDEPQGKDDDRPNVVDDSGYGLMLFRRDTWRSGANSDQDVEVRALYLVPESGTYGLQRMALRCALWKVDAEITSVTSEEDHEHRRIEFEERPGCAEPAKPAEHAADSAKANPSITLMPPTCRPEAANTPHFGGILTLFGPTFSGSLDSIREALFDVSASAEDHLCRIKTLRLLASSTTAHSNARAASGDKGRAIRYVSLALEDDAKLKYISRLTDELHIDPKRVAIVYETTVFGIDACRTYLGYRTPDVCRSAITIPLPVNIADVRFGLREKQLAHAVNSKLPINSEAKRLPLEDGAENGSEFPESQQSPLTAASTGLQLEQLVNTLQTRRAQLVVIIATDVRDRLFLIEKMSEVLNGALFVDLETDRLLGHPDFIHATRGTLALSSSRLATPPQTTCKAEKQSPCGTYYSWATDEQATLVAAIAAWPAESNPSRAGQDPYPHVVSRAGLISSVDTADNELWCDIEVASSVLAALIFASIGITRVSKSQGAIRIRQWREPIERVLWPVLAVCTLATLVALVSNWVALASAAGALAVSIVLWTKNTRPDWASAVIWATSLLLTISALLEFTSVIAWFWDGTFSSTQAAEMRRLLGALSQSPSGGLSYPLAQCVAVAAMSLALLIAHLIQKSIELADELLCDIVPESVFTALREIAQKGGVASVAVTVAVGSAATGLFLFLPARQVTVFGMSADISVFVSLIATTLMAGFSLIGALTSVARIYGLCAWVNGWLRSSKNFDPKPDDESQPLLWSGLPGDRPSFVATPVLAHAWCGGMPITALRNHRDNWRTELYEIQNSLPLTGPRLNALYALLAAEMGNYQLSIAGVAISASASSLIIYLFPVSEATGLMLLNLAALVVAGGYSAHQTVAFEGNLILSNVLCNRPQQRKWSMTLFAGVAIPFVALAIVIGISQIPGVLDIGDGLLSALLKYFKLGGGD